MQNEKLLENALKTTSNRYKTKEEVLASEINEYKKCEKLLEKTLKIASNRHKTKEEMLTSEKNVERNRI